MPAPARSCLAVGLAISILAPDAQARPLAQSAEEAAWQDQVIAPEDLEPLPPDEDAGFDADGLPRSFRMELLMSRTERGAETFTETGASLGGFRDTEMHGTFSLDATVQRADGRQGEDAEWGGKATLWQRGLYMDGGWRANNGLGVLNTPSPELLRQQYRFFLPSVPFAGASTEWLQGRDDLQLQASLGRAGVFNGARVVGFELADGNVGSVSGQWRLDSRWRAAASVLATDGRIVPDEQGGTFFQDGRTRALHAATGWDDGRNSVNANLQASNGDFGNAWGAWLDVQHERGRYTHNYGAFNLQPDLAWGAQPINNDNRGAYYRLNYQHARWTWNAGFDRITSISGDTFDGWYGTAFARYQASTATGYGASVALRDAGDSDALATQLFMDRTNRWGNSRAQLEYAGSTGGAKDDSWQLSLDQSLQLQQGKRLTLTAAYGELSYDDRPATGTYSVAAYGGIDLTDRLTLDGTARWTQGDGPDAFRGADINLNLAWRVANRWWLVATLYENRGSRRSPFVIDPLATEQPFVNLPRDRSLFLSLRYQHRAGTASGVLGGPPGSPVGSITGSVYLDDNGDGQRAASEQPAANVTVLLDGLYAVRTDSNGEFSFPRVAVGAHVVTVLPDNLPLPWFLDEQADRRSIEVVVRETTRVDIGARRQR